MPEVTVEAIRTQVQSRKLAAVYLLHGEDVRHIETMVDAFEALVDPADRPFAVERIYAGEERGAPIDVAAAANVFPMLGDRRIVFVMRAEKFLKPPRAGQAAAGASEESDEAELAEGEEEGGAMDVTPLIEYLKNPAPTSVLVFVAAGIDRGRRLTKQLLEKAVHAEFGGLGGKPEERREAKRHVAAQLQREFAAAGRTVDPKALAMLVERAGGDISKLRGDVERLLLFTEGQKSISRSDIEEVVTDDPDIDDWDIVNAISAGDLPRALRETAARFDRGDSVHALVGQLRWWVTVKLSAAAPERVKPAMEALLRADLDLKSPAAKGDAARTLVERLVVDLTGRPIPSWGPGRR